MDKLENYSSLGQLMVDLTWEKINHKLEDSKLQLCALKESWKVSLAPQEMCVQRASADIDSLLKITEPAIIQKESEEAKKNGYCYYSSESDLIFFHAPGKSYSKFSDIAHEFESRHPGTTQERDSDDFLFAARLRKSVNDEFSPITTLAAQQLTSLTFAAPRYADFPTRCDMYPSYPMQLSVRTDDHRKFLYYDCFEFKAKWWRLESDPLPSERKYEYFQSSLQMGGRSPKRLHHPWAFDSDDECSDGYVSPDDDGTPMELAPVPDVKEMNLRRIDVKLNTHGGEFIESRMLRIKVSLSDVCGLQLRSPVTPDDDGEAQSVLIIEFTHPDVDFAVRCVHASLLGDNTFTLIDDWSPGKVASRSTRHYICGRQEEITSLASHIAELCKLTCDVFQENQLTSSNSLTGQGVDISVNSAPPAKQPKVNVGDAVEKKVQVNKLSEADVHKILTKKCGVVNLENVSACLKKAIYEGHIKIGRKGVQTVLKMPNYKYSAGQKQCFKCRTNVVVTVADILYQPDNGGFDYASEDATFKCSKCNQGIYISDMCTGRPRLDSGRAHNHCRECDGFGVCLGDYRESHCKDCGEHWFEGNSGFPCVHCGGGHGKGREGIPLTERALPDDSTWDGNSGYSELGSGWKDHTYARMTSVDEAAVYADVEKKKMIWSR